MTLSVIVLEHKNWLEQWWKDKAYLEERTSLLNINFGGPAEYRDFGWELKEGTQVWGLNKLIMNELVVHIAKLNNDSDINRNGLIYELST